MIYISSLKHLSSLLFFIFIAGCATTERYALPQDADASSLASIYLYRTNTLFHSLNPEKPYIYLDDKVIATLGTGETEFLKVPAGKYRLSVRQPLLFMPSNESDSFEAEFEAGESYYIRYALDFDEVVSYGEGAAVTGTSNFHMVDKATYDERR